MNEINSTRTEKPIGFELVPHPQGHWKINGRNYRPQWSRAVEVDEFEVRTVIDKVVSTLDIDYQHTSLSPRIIQIQYIGRDNIVILSRD